MEEQKEEWKKIIKSCYHGYYCEMHMNHVAIETIQQLMMGHPNKKEDVIDWKDDNIMDGWTMLNCASYNGRFDIVKLLLEHGADTSIPDKNGTTPSMSASSNGHNDIVGLLVERSNVDINSTDKAGKTALMTASWNGHADTVKLLLEKGADVNNADEQGCTALMRASMNGYTDIVKLLVDKVADINIGNKEGKTALMLASMYGSTVVVDLLLEKGANCKIADDNGDTALMIASSGGENNVMKLLVDKGNADIEIANKKGNTALMLACESFIRERKDTVKLLLDMGANINIANKKDGQTALMKASRDGHIDTAKLLVDMGADVNVLDKHGKTALSWALENFETKMVEFLWDKGAKINKVTDKELVDATLKSASEQGHSRIVELLLEKGADINFGDEKGITALMRASNKGQSDIVRLLVDKGNADIAIADKDGMTALMYASAEGHSDIVKHLVNKGANINIANNDGMTALSLVFKNGHNDILELLVEKDADIKVANKDGTTALMYASKNGLTDIVKRLLNKDADSSVVDNDGMTALMYASQGGHAKIVELLTERSLSQDIRSLLDAGVTIERLKELYLKEEVHKVVQAHIVEQAKEEPDRPVRSTAAAALTVEVCASSTVKVGDNENVQGLPDPDGPEIERSQFMDIGSLADAGVMMEKLEEIYPKEEVHKVVQARIMKQTKREDEMQRGRRGSLARLLFLRSKSTELKEVLRNSAVMDQVLVSLLADPEEKILMCPLMRVPLKDPVVISSGFVMDRSTALDEDGHLRMQLCPFSREVLCMPVYPCIPIRSKLKAWEMERMNRCFGVAEKMVESNEWDRATKVFDIAETFLQEMGYQTYMNLATKLTKLERTIPFVENDVERMVKIHRRLIRTAKGDKGGTIKLLREAIKDCCKILGGSMLSDDPVMLQECKKTRSAFSQEVLSPVTLIDVQDELRDELLELYGLDLVLAKKLKSTAEVWCSRGMILGLLETQSCDDDKNSNANVTKISEFLKQEGLLSLGNYDSLRYWPQDKLVEERIGLARFGDHGNAKDEVEAINNLTCKVDLNPNNGSDHWVEVAFRPTTLGFPSCKFCIFSQHGPGMGWEIRAGKETYNEKNNFVEAVWTTTNADGRLVQKNEFFNKHVSVEPGQWYHVILSCNSKTLEVKLYVNGQPASKTVEGTFKPDSRFPMIGQNLEWPDRQFKGMVAYASGDTQFPVDYAEADGYVRCLSHVRLQKLRECSEAMALTAETGECSQPTVKLDLTDFFDGGDGDY